MVSMDIDRIRRTATAALDQSRRPELGQFFTPSTIAAHMAAMFPPAQGPVRLLDAGAGIGVLSAAAASAFRLSKITAWEVDPTLVGVLTETLEATGADFEVLNSDFVLAAPQLAANGTRFDRAILNPPYRKVGTSSPHRKALEAMGVPVVNLYTAFLAASLELLEHGGVLVAIVPRSFLNGLYHLPFRRKTLASASLDNIHVFHSRRSAFADDKVLQENVIVRFTKGGRQGYVTLSHSSDATFADTGSRAVPFSDVVRPGDSNLTIRIPPDGMPSNGDGVGLASLGIAVSTGPVVEYRCRHLASADDAGVQLVSSWHLSGGALVHPAPAAPVNRLALPAQDPQRWPAGDYVVVRRIAPKETKRRIAAFHLRKEDLDPEGVAFENRLNVFHCGKKGLDRVVAERLCVYLNSDAAEDEFNSISGTTQVNATDLRAMSYPGGLSGS